MSLCCYFNMLLINKSKLVILLTLSVRKMYNKYELFWTVCKFTKKWYYGIIKINVLISRGTIMARCDVCNKIYQGWFDKKNIKNYQDGTCCLRCLHAAEKAKKEFEGYEKEVIIGSVQEVKTLLSMKKKWDLFIDEAENYLVSEYKKFGIQFKPERCSWGGAYLFGEIHGDCVEIDDSEKIISIINDKLYIIKSYRHYISNHLEDLKPLNLDALKNLKMKPIVCSVISISDIQYFCEEGDVSLVSDVNGGGGGGSSVSGAVIGGIIGGSTGAIIGSRNKVSPVTTHVYTHSTQKTILVYLKDDKLIAEEYPSHELYEYLLSKVPEKDLRTLQFLNSKQQEKTSSESIVEEIKKYKQLYDEGILTEEEFTAKKKQLLGL